MSHPCPFCLRDEDLQQRTFYDHGRWFAFLAAPPSIAGHTILAVKGSDPCPQELTAEVLSGIDTALADVAKLLRGHYRPKHVLFASLRASDPHVHLHVFPVSESAVAEWRERKGNGHESGRLFEFLGDLESTAFSAQSAERERNGWSKAQQRSAHAQKLRPDVGALQVLLKDS